MLIKRLYIIFFCLSGIQFIARAQQDPEFTQFMFNKLYYNPAYAGVEGVTRFNLLLRSKWTGYTSTFDGSGGAPTTEIVSFNTPIFKINSGFGAYVINDHLGNLNNLAFQASYAYHLAVKEAKLSFGINAGFFSQSIDFSQYRPSDPNDPLIGQGKETQVQPDFGLGVFYQSEKMYASASVSHLLNPSFNFGNDNLRNSLQTGLAVMGGYNYDLTYNIMITPSILVQSDFKKTLVNFGATVEYNNKFWGGLTYKHQESIALILGMNMLKNNAMQVGYGFDYIVNDQDSKQPTSHELRLSYALPVSAFGGRKVVRTPRFRH